MNLLMPPPNSLKPPFSIPFSLPLFSNNSSFSPFAYPFCTFLHLHTNKGFNKMIKCSFRQEKVLEPEDAALLVFRCITRTLPPALSLEQGLDRIQEAVEELKSKPPCSSSGMFRFQVAVPPSAKALSLFCSQHDSTGVFPQFFMSKEENPTYKSLALGRTRGIFGIGAAFFFKATYSHAYSDYGGSKRYPALQSTFPTAYGFLDVKIDLKSSSTKHETGSFYLFIPQIELDELKEVPVLVATLAWNSSSFCFFKDAIQSYEFCLYQIRNYFPSFTDECSRNHIKYVSTDFTVKKGENLQLVCMSAARLGRKLLEAGTLELKDASFRSSQFFALLSRSVSIANNMNESDRLLQLRYSLLKCANINTLWASLIIEECTRLGLTYICVAPGSRSSPLAIAASTHSLTTCVACIDERSLAFHAVGYARGSRKPAVIITSSGTAASNLLPAVVEASQDFLPLLILTADRPPELQDVGANQAINQVNHFGPFVRHFFGLPAPCDEISARMVLTTIDSAVNVATSPPYGPVHINCPFREPLENILKAWISNCLKGLDLWMSTAEPYTTYIQGQHSNLNYQMYEVVKLIQAAERGLLIVGAVQTEDDIWAALLLAEHLSWPVAVDILSGLRLRKHMDSFTGSKEHILFIDHLDYLLLSKSVKDWMQPDVVIQIGSRITSMRIAEMLDHALPHYIMVERHPSRHDPLHIVSHRIKCTISEFVKNLIKVNIPCLCNKWKIYLQALEMMAAWETSFLINSEYSLTEPYVAHVIPDSLLAESSIFVGNSMPIRDADMYASNQPQYAHNDALTSRLGLPCHWIQVVGNRGASGIDGLLSTAVGFSAGCNKNVLCIIGDVSFLHDTNGLALLGQGIPRKPMIILVINNHGGAIFSLLPNVNMTERRILDQFFYTSHNVSISSLCLAHSVKHVHVRTKMELLDALFTSQQGKIDCVIEVESSIDSTSDFHSNLRKFGSHAADCAMHVLSHLSPAGTSLGGLITNRIAKMECSLYRIKLCTPPTSSSLNYKSVTFYREGFVVALTLDDGSTGYGEVAPIEIHEESLQDVEEQLRFLTHVLQGAKVDIFLPLLKGSFSSWIWNSLGISPGSLFPSVRCGLEMAVLSAISAREGCSILNILLPRSKDLPITLQGVRMCALIDSAGSPEDIAHVANSLVEEGFTALKIKVARRTDPIEDIAVVQEVRRKVGPEVQLRVDANRNWTYEVAVQFAKAVKNCGLQYIEEPVRDADDIIRFFEETGLPVALDETLYCIQENPIELLKTYAHPGVIAMVMKPSALGGFENTALFAQWAQQCGKMAVVSATFESSLGLSGFIQLSSFLDLQNANSCSSINKEKTMFPAHGLGTYKWLKEDVTTEPLNICCNSETGFVEASAAEAGQFMLQFHMNQNVVVRKFSEEYVHNYQLEVDLDGILFSVNISETGQSNADNIVIFLHGFLGTREDWIPIMKSIAGSSRCVAIDLPGHGGSKLQHQAKNGFTPRPSLSMDVISKLLCKLLPCISAKKVILVGYSMGARISLYMALKYSDKVERAVLISGSPGLVDPLARMVRRAGDDFKACSLVSYGLDFFLDSWYAEELWSSLRSHPRFKTIYAKRLQHDDLQNLANVLSDLSIGRQPSLWEDLKHCKLPLMLIVGEKDAKFKKLSREMVHKIGHHATTGHGAEIVEISNSGHAPHLENPLPVITAIRQFLKRKRSVQVSTVEDIDVKVPPSQKMEC